MKIKEKIQKRARGGFAPIAVLASLLEEVAFQPRSAGLGQGPQHTG